MNSVPSHQDYPKGRSISRRFSYAFIGVVTLILFGFATAAIFFNIARVDTELNNRLENASMLAEIGLPTALWSFEYDTVDDFVRALFLDKSIVYAKVLWGISRQTGLSTELQIITERKRNEYQEKDFEYFRNSSEFIAETSPIVHDGEYIGEIQLVISRQNVKQELLLNVLSIVALAILVIIAISLTSIVISRRYIARPLMKLQHSAALIAEGDLEAPIETGRGDEIGRLAEDLSVMRGSLKQLFGELTESKDKLEEKVEQRTADLASAKTEAEEARAVAEEASRAKSTFLANMSHELRTPLNAIIGYSEMLLEDVEASGQKEFIPDLQKIAASGQHLLSLINEILDLSKIEAGKMDLYLESLDVKRMIEEVLSTIQLLAEQNENDLKVQWGDNLGTMYADLTKVRQSLFNLLSNACKFTERGTVSLDVFRDTLDGVDWLTFSISDTGIGMTEEQIGRLFQEFSQAEVSTTRKYGGTGLGLLLSEQFCQMMGGDIAVESELGIGSTFTIRLPAKVVDHKAELATLEEVRLEAGPEGASTVLVIDDDAMVLELMKRFLSKEGYRVVTAKGGKEGLRLARELIPDVITLDVIMSEMDSWAVLSALKGDSDLANTPVIMLTIVDDKSMGYRLGASDYLTKPINRNRLVAAVRKHAPPPCGVLVVEDDAEMRELLQRFLQNEGWVVVEAQNGREALDRISENKPELILLDLMMPTMDGFEFLEELRKHTAWLSIPVLVITAKDLTAEERRRLDGRVNKILQKGAYSREKLLAEVHDLVADYISQSAGDES
ncbi:MAG: response regulator [Deltaproteobacteria bacterium]|nr:response regulator [Deltaproteobacteria bacterium]